MASGSIATRNNIYAVPLRGHTSKLAKSYFEFVMKLILFQVHILRVVLSLACSASWALNGRLVMLLISRCGEAYENGTQPVRAAAQAAASQTLTAFCSFLGKICKKKISICLLLFRFS